MEVLYGPGESEEVPPSLISMAIAMLASSAQEVPISCYITDGHRCMSSMWFGGCSQLENCQLTHEFSVGHEPPCACMLTTFFIAG